jgi:hypothetical protein
MATRYEWMMLLAAGVRPDMNVLHYWLMMKEYTFLDVEKVITGKWKRSILTSRSIPNYCYALYKKTLNTIGILFLWYRSPGYQRIRRNFVISPVGIYHVLIWRISTWNGEDQ